MMLHNQILRYCRWLHGGVGKRGGLYASSSGHTITFLPSCHWNSSTLCVISVLSNGFAELLNVQRRQPL